ncbi:MAG: carbohydrate kinase family protein [Elusimicrobiota bacterium]
MKNPNIGLIGTMTWDRIARHEGSFWKGPGGMFYQAAVLDALGARVHLFANLGKELSKKVEDIRKNWKNLNWDNVNIVPGPGHRVKLYYPVTGERREIVTGTVDSLVLNGKIKKFNSFDLTMCILNTGYDLKFESWRKIVENTARGSSLHQYDDDENLIWLDIHSLALTPEPGEIRKYRSIKFWYKWAEGVDYLQANEKEAACMLGNPDMDITEKNIKGLARKFFETGGRAFFVTRGKKGVNIFLPGEHFFIKPPAVDKVVDTTGCGDVLGSVTAYRLAGGDSPREAVKQGLKYASETAGLNGPGKVRKIFKKRESRL